MKKINIIIVTIALNIIVPIGCGEGGDGVGTQLHSYDDIARPEVTISVVDDVGYETYINALKGGDRNKKFKTYYFKTTSTDSSLKYFPDEPKHRSDKKKVKLPAGKYYLILRPNRLSEWMGLDIDVKLIKDSTIVQQILKYPRLGKKSLCFQEILKYPMTVESDMILSIEWVVVRCFDRNV